MQNAYPEGNTNPDGKNCPDGNASRRMGAIP